jgi:hypothetical protein
VPAGVAPRRDRPAPATRRRRLLFGGWAAATAAAAAAAILAIVRPWAGPAPLPSYEAHLAGDTRAWRSPERPPQAPPAARPREFQPGNRLELVLTPAVAVEARPEVATFLVRSGDLAAWAVPFEVSDYGAVRVAGTVGEDVQLPPGESTMVVAIGSPGALPPPAELRSRLAAAVRGGAAAGCRPFLDGALVCSFAVNLRTGR